MKLRAAVFGASGYSGAELVRTLHSHPRAEIAALGADSSAGVDLASLYPALRGAKLPKLEKLEAATLQGRADLAFLCLPHTQSMGLVPGLLDAGLKVIDLGGDFRLKDAALYEKFYGQAHTAGQLLPEAVYGLPEVNGEAVKKARLVANPGCYTTTSILGLLPLAKSGKIGAQSIIIDAKSGVSGSGRKLSQSSQFAEAYDNFSAYKVGGVHQHIPEIEMMLGAQVTFTPHLLPLSRGIFATCYVDTTLAEDEIFALYQSAYAKAPFVRVYPKGELPTLRSVRGTNYCDIGLKLDARTKRAIVVACTDNLMKGAATQAVQNMNLMFGFDEAEGLNFSALPV